MNKKELIVQTTIDLLVTQGIQETPMSQISKVSGVAMGTIYHHFKSKSDLINYIYKELKKEIGDVIAHNHDKTEKYKVQFFRIWKNLFNHYYNQKQKFIFCQYIGNLPVIDTETKLEAQMYFQPAVDFMIAGIATKELKNININLMTETVHGNIVSLIYLTHTNTINFTDAILDQAINLSWDGIKLK